MIALAALIILAVVFRNAPATAGHVFVVAAFILFFISLAVQHVCEHFAELTLEDDDE